MAGVLVMAGALAAVHHRGGDHAAAPVHVSGLPAPGSGQRWVTWHGVAVQVPATWPYGYEPGGDWCANTRPDQEAAPYVALDPTYGPHSDVGCTRTGHHDQVFGPAPESRWADHVALQSPRGRDGTWHEGAWTLTTRTVAHVQVKVLSRDSTRAAAILDSARTITVDDAGCAVSSPIQNLDHLRPDPFYVTSVDSVDAVSVCQYDRTVPASQPGLMASHLMTGATAVEYLNALKAAPTGGGPDDPDNCVDHQDDGTGIVVRLWSATTSDDLYAYYDWCRDNGIDDGADRRALTHATCAPLFAEPPVTLWQFQEDLVSICASTSRP